jgi:transposase-like protein
MGQRRKHFSPDVKLKIIKELLLDKLPMSELSETYGIPPSSIYQWQQQLFTAGTAAFQRKNDRHTGESAGRRHEKKIADLEAKLAAKNEVVGEIMEEMVKLKKLNGAT